MSDPFKILEPTVISFSGGRTSAYMLWRILQSNGGGLPDDAIVCFANTGKEDEATLRFVKDCEDNWGCKIHWLEYQDSIDPKNRFKIVNYDTAARNGEPFEAVINAKQFLPNVFMRFCTQELKIKVIDKFIASLGMNSDEMERLIGIRADEQRRVAKVGLQNSPLAQEGITSFDIGKFWSSNSFDLNLPKVGLNTLSNCDLCFLKGDKLLYALIKDKPSRATWWIKQEEKLQKMVVDKERKGIATFRKNSISYAAMMQNTLDQSDMFSDESIACFCGD